MEAESVEVDIIGSTLQSLPKCKENGEVRSKEAPPSIYMVPSRLRDLSPSSFNPRTVAIGPLHRQDEHLQGFEVQKTTYFHNWLHKFGVVPEQTLRKCVEKVIGEIERIKACYAGKMRYNDSELAKMMVIDACFILEFVMILSKAESSNMLIISSIKSDLLLIENQIPFFVLEIIFECTAIASGQMREGFSLTMYMTILVNHFNFIKENAEIHDASAPDHILSLLHKYYRPVEPITKRYESSLKWHTALELDNAGMNFKPNNEDQNWALNMKLELPLPWFPWFHSFMVIPPISWFQRPTIRMPKLWLSSLTELIFRNLVVYEQTSDVKYVTVYLCAMDFLIDTPQDVDVLVK